MRPFKYGSVELSSPLLPTLSKAPAQGFETAKAIFSLVFDEGHQGTLNELVWFPSFKEFIKNKRVTGA